MKVLIVSAYFPPGNAIGAVRLGKLARHLTENGCDVRVISAVDETLAPTLPTEIDADRVIATKWFDIHSFPRILLKLGANDGLETISKSKGRLLGITYNVFRALFHWPDRHIGWFFPARKAGRRLIAEWRPDVIYASAWPITSLFVGASLSKEFSIPWIAELRDLWLDNHYHSIPVWRRWIDRVIERKLLLSAALLVTVSEPLAERLRSKFSRPTAVVLNGFDPSDFPARDNSGRTDCLTITYTGTIYPGRRDPRPLFSALKQMGPLAKRVRVRFFGRLLPGVQSLIESYDLGECVEVFAPVPYRDALKIQTESDVLLMLTWDSPEERGVYTGKLFEYLGAKRPILLLGHEQGVAADLLRERRAGVVANDQQRIVEALTRWLDEKDSLGEIPALEESACAGLSRTEQFDHLLPQIRTVAQRPFCKPKVVVVTRKLDVGGTEHHLLQVLPHLATKFDVSVFVIYAGGKLESGLVRLGIPVFGPELNVGNCVTRIVAAIWLCAIFLRNRNAVIHFVLPEPYLIGGICGSVLGHQRMVMSRRSLNEYFKSHKVLAAVEKKLHQRMQFVIGNSRAVLNELFYEGVPESRLRLIYNGVDIRRFQNKGVGGVSRVQLGIMPGELVIITVANLIPYKGHEDLIRALEQIAPQMDMPWRLILIGRDDGIQVQLQELVSSLRLSERVVFVGQVSDASAYWAIGDIGVLPSHQEGFSNSILEGMAAGLPMVVTNVGGNAEAVLHEVTGLVVPPHSPNELAAALNSLILNAPKRRAFGRAAYLRVKEKFSLDNCLIAYSNLYSEILRGEECL